MQGAIIGYGTIAQGHCTGYGRLPDMAVTAVVDPSPERRAAAEAQGLRAFPTLSDLLGDRRPDFLDICTPPSSHWDYIADAIERSIPVLCEKPVFVPARVDYTSMMKAIAAADVVVYPCQNYKFAPVFANLRARIKAGQIGEVVSVRVAVMRASHARGVAEWKPNWRRADELAAGGILRDHGPHGIYLATSLSGLTPIAVSCVLGTMRGTPDWTNEDTALLRIRCAGDADIELYLSWAAGLRDSRYAVTGTKGFISIENDKLVAGADGRIDRELIRSGFDDPAHGEWFAAMLADFRDAVLAPAQHSEHVRSLLDEAMLTTAVIDAAYRSAEHSGTWCDITQFAMPVEA
ncbi:Gfo/Idh/MocA family protein [Streptomyces sp. NRRL S-1824]|uniref:Gfo/Idh/MocA family protein n=1 Tax=Streptomyces sp. NRRL S-1824 TaxID=1463889 RepID=UPI0004C74E7F|nr:Gfo/Idh/MocA family oxidoreductase [Streptomyces sp. NRRL S-1824]